MFLKNNDLGVVWFSVITNDRDSLFSILCSENEYESQNNLLDADSQRFYHLFFYSFYENIYFYKSSDGMINKAGVWLYKKIFGGHLSFCFDPFVFGIQAYLWQYGLFHKFISLAWKTIETYYCRWFEECPENSDNNRGRTIGYKR